MCVSPDWLFEPPTHTTCYRLTSQDGPHKTGQYNTKIPTHQRGKFVVRVRVRVSVSYVGVNVIVTTVLLMVLTRKGERNKLVVGVG